MLFTSGADTVDSLMACQSSHFRSFSAQLPAKHSPTCMYACCSASTSCTSLLNCRLLFHIYFLFVKITLNYSPPAQNTCSSSQAGVTASLKSFLFTLQPTSRTNASNGISPRADSCKCHIGSELMIGTSK